MKSFLNVHATRLLLLAALFLGAGSLTAVPLTMSYQVTDLGGGTFQYDFLLVCDNNDATYQPGQGWGWLIFGDANSGPSPLTNWQIAAGQLPVGPWTGMSSSGGGHNGPTFSYVLDAWIPYGVGDSLHWRGTSNANLPQGQMLWSTIAGNVGNPSTANFTVATRVDPGIRVDATAGTVVSVLNTESGGGNGFQAGTFVLTNTSAAVATVTDLTISGFGTGSHTSIYTEFAVYRDQTGSGTVGSYDTGDQLISTGTLTGGPPSAAFTLTGGEETFAASVAKRYFIVVELNGTEITGRTLQYQVTGVTAGGGTTLFNVPSHVMKGLVIDGPGVTVTATPGASEPVLNNETGGGLGFEAGRFTLTATNFATTINSLTIGGSGTGDHLSDYTEFALYRDNTATGTVGSYDNANDQLVGTGTFSSPPALTTIGFTGAEQNFAANQTKTYFIVIKLGGTASVTETFNYVVQAGSFAGTAALLGAPSATINGVNIIQAEVTYDGVAVNTPGVIPYGMSNHVVQAFKLAASSVSAQSISDVTFNKTGTIADSDITEVKLWQDNNTNGFLDTGEPQVGSTQTFSGGALTFTGAPLISLNASQAVNYVLTFTITNAVVASGTTFGATLNPVTNISATPGPVRVTTAVTTATFTIWLVTAYPYADALEFLVTDEGNPVPLSNGWWNDTSDGGGFDWFIGQGPTIFSGSGAGPTADHNPGTSLGHYLYFPDYITNTTATAPLLRTPPFDISALSNPGLSFWLHHKDGSVGTYGSNQLHVDVLEPLTGNVTQNIITPISFQGANWVPVSIDLSTLTATIIQFQFRITCDVNNYLNDIVLDDFVVRDFPEINIQNASAANIADGGTDSIGGVNTSGQTFQWTIQNLGGVNLNLTGGPLVSVTPISNVNVSVTDFPSATIGPSSSDTFDVLVTPLGAGAFSFTVTISNDDADESSYTFTVDGTGVANTPPSVSIPGGSNWQNVGGNFELALDPGTAYGDDLVVTDPTPDNMTMTVTPPGTLPSTVTSQPATISTFTAGPFTLTWAGTADGTNPPGSYTWQISVDDGFNTINFTATIIINDLPPTHAIGADATTGDGLAAATAYNGSALVGTTAALTLADVSNPNTTQAITLGTVTPNGANPAGGSGFGITLVGNSIVATPTAALQLSDLGTHAFAVDVEDTANTVTVHVSVTVVSPEIAVARGVAIPNGGADTVTGALAGQPVVLTYNVSNTGTAALTITTVVLSGQVNCSATVTANPGGTVNPGNATTFDVTVTPTAPGAFNFDIDINNSDVDEDPYEIAVSGNAAAAPEIDISRAGTPVADSGSDAVGDSNAGQGRDLVYTITNSGTSNLSVGAVTASLPLNCAVVVTVNPGATVTPGNSTTFTVRVSPTATGPFSFTVSVINGDANENPYDFVVSGNGVSGGTSSGGGGGGGGGGCTGAGESGAVVLLALLALGAMRARRRRA